MLLRRFRGILTILVTAAAAVSGWAQTLPIDPRFEHLTVDDGLPDSSVRAMVQDRLGFLWFGTQNGLVRYDGRLMTPYAPLDEATGRYNSLATIALLEDRDGDIWIGTFSTGLWRLRPHLGTFDRWGPSSTVDRQLGGLQVEGLCQAPDGTVWASTSEGTLAGVDPRTGLVQRIRRQPGAPLESAPADTVQTSVLVDTAGRLWVTSEGMGVAFRAPGSAIWHHFRHDPEDRTSLPSDIVTEVHEDDRRRIWFTTRVGLARFHPDTQGFTRYVPRPGDRESMLNYLVKIDHDQTGRLWLGAASGMYSFDPNLSVFQYYGHDPTRAGSVLRGPVLSMLCDTAGIVWGGTWHAGLNKLDPNGNRFRVETHMAKAPDSQSLESVQAVFEDSRGVLWVGSGDRTPGVSVGGLNSRLPGTTEFRRHRFSPDDPLQPSTVYSFSEDRHGALWIGTDRGLWTLPPGKLIPERIPGLSTPGAPLHRIAVQGLAIDLHGHIWVGGYSSGVRVFEPETDRIRAYTTDVGDAADPSSRNVHSFYRDRQGRMWILYDTRGLAYYDEPSDRLIPYFDPDLGLISPMDIVEDHQGELWVGTFAGLLRLDDEGNVVEVVDARDGLPNEMVGAVLVDDRGRLWMSTGRGFVRFDPRSGDLRTYDTSDGLPTNEVHFGRVRSSTGTLYFGGPAGLTSFDPAGFDGSDFVPPVVITELRIADSEIRPGPGSPLAVSIEHTREISLPHRDNDLTIGFAALHFARPERNGYRYRLDGADDIWRDPGHDPRAFYTNLAPGRYTFHLRGSNADGLWNEDETTLAIRIRQPWWFSTWAIAIYVLATLGFVALVYRQIIQRERMRTALEVGQAEARQLQELDRLRTRFFANVSHEFRTPLTLLRTPLHQLRDAPETGDADLFSMMSRNADRLGQLIDQLLDLSRLEAGRLPLNWRCDDVTRFLTSLVAGFGPLTRERQIDLQINLPGEPALLWFDADLLEKVTGNLLSNAIKHTPPTGRVVVRATVASSATPHPVPAAAGNQQSTSERPARQLHFSVANTGSYIPPAEYDLVFDRFHQLAGGSEAGGSGIGLALVRELVTMLGGTIGLSSEPDMGTCFTVELPLFSTAPADVIGAADAPTESAVTAANAVTHDEDDEDGDAAAVTALPRLLVVEDDADLRAYLARELSPHYEVITAADGDEGLTVALAEIPDLVVSDVMMPGRDGFELCRRLKTDWRTSHVPVILLTAKAGTESRLTGLEQGADDYLVKPFDARELLTRVANLIALRRQLQERFAAQVQGTQVEALPVVSMDDRFLKRCREIIDERLDDADMTVESYARDVGLSRAQLHRKLKALTGLSPREFVRAHRLLRGAELLRGRFGNVTEVAYSVGFKNPSHFARCFREQFDVSPSAYFDGANADSDEPNP